MSLTIEAIDNLPAVRRGKGRTSAEREQLKAALSTGTPQVIRNIEVGKPYNAMQQRIRQAGADLGLKVKISYQKNDEGTSGDLAFQGIAVIEDEIVVVPKAATKKSVKTDA